MNAPDSHYDLSTPAMIGRMEASLEPLPSRAALAAEWRELEDRSVASFYVSWAWIGAWLDTLPEATRPDVLRVRLDGRLVGLALLARRTAWRHGFVRSRGLHLNSTGDPSLDEINIEHNGMLSEMGLESLVLDAAVSFLLQRQPSWDELHIPGLASPASLDALGRHALTVRRVNEGPCRYVDLAALARDGRRHLDVLGKSTRYNVRRSQREYAALGELVLDEARTREEAGTWLGRLATLHQRYWTARGEPGSFANPFFEDFHRRLVDSAFDDGAIQLLRVRAGEHEVGYLYNHVHRGRVFNYQSGFDYGDGRASQRRPGMVAHSLAIEHCAAQGCLAYDFLAGDSDFKRAFATHEVPMAWCVAQRPRAVFRIEDGLRHVRRRYFPSRR